MIIETFIVMAGLYFIVCELLEQRRRETKTGEFAPDKEDSK